MSLTGNILPRPAIIQQRGIVAFTKENRWEKKVVCSGRWKVEDEKIHKKIIYLFA